jgi:predicted dehydrogenase
MKKQFISSCFLLLIIFIPNLHGNISNLSGTKQISKKIILIGAGGNKGKTYFNLLKNYINFVGFIHPEPKKNLLSLSKKYNIPIYPNIKSAINNIDFDGAILAVPHHLHFNYTKDLLNLKKFVIKEKPISITSKESGILLNNSIPPLFVIVQRQFQNSFLYAQKQLAKIGKICSFKYIYNLGSKEASSWRAEQKKCFGGVLLDMGYHIIDIINSFFGTPEYLTGQFVYKTKQMKQEKLEDEAFFLFAYSNGIVGNITISRLGPNKEEFFEIIGETGIIKVNQRSCQLFDSFGQLIEIFESPASKTEEIFFMFATYFNQLNNKDFIEKELKRHQENIKIIESLYSLKN